MSNKIFVGYDTREDIAYQVCEHSIKRYNNDAEVIPLIQKDLRQSKIIKHSSIIIYQKSRHSIGRVADNEEDKGE